MFNKLLLDKPIYVYLCLGVAVDKSRYYFSLYYSMSIKHCVVVTALLIGMWNTHAQTTIKIAFEQPALFQVSPKSVLVNLQGNPLMELGSDITVSGGSSPYSYVWKTGDQELSESPILQVSASGVYILEVSDKNDCVCTAQYNVSEGSPVQSVEADLLALYPNPTPGIVYLASSQMEAIRNLSVISANGEVYPCEKKVTGNPLQCEIDMKHLPDGMYYLVIQFDNRIITKPVVLKK